MPYSALQYAHGLPSSSSAQEAKNSGRCEGEGITREREDAGEPVKRWRWVQKRRNVSMLGCEVMRHCCLNCCTWLGTALLGMASHQAAHT